MFTPSALPIGKLFLQSGMMMKKALVTGITGQDGAYLAKSLLRLGYQVFGGYRRTASANFWRIEEIGIAEDANLSLVELDLTDQSAGIHILESTEVDEVYNLAAQSFVAVSFSHPASTSQITGLGALNMLEAIRLVNPRIRFYQASSSEMFGKVQAIPQSEDTPFYPRSPYGVAKLFAHWMTVNYRESYDIFGASGILFNHESPLRGSEFVTRKISRSVARIARGQDRTLELGNLDAKRDWGFAGDYVDGMWRMLQADEPDTFVLATGRTESVRQFVRLAFSTAGIDVEFQGEGDKEVAIAADATEFVEKGQVVVRVNPAYYRPAEVDLLIGDYTKASTVLGWEPSTSLEELCRMMVKADLNRHLSISCR